MASFWLVSICSEEKGILPLRGRGITIRRAVAKHRVDRKREFMADASGSLLTRNPEGLASALEKIAGDPTKLRVANKATAHLFISNPLKKKSIAKLFSTHPPMEERVAALRGMENSSS